MADYLNDGPEEEFVSKTQRKKQMDALQDLGRELVDLPNDKLQKIRLPEDLLNAILEYRRITSNGAKRRQAQYIGRLMREIDPDPIRAALAVSKGESAAHAAWLHQIERWRERLLEDDAALPQFVDAHPQAEVQPLRALIRNARKERQEARPPKHFRQLFQAIKDIIPEPALPGAGDADGDEA